MLIFKKNGKGRVKIKKNDSPKGKAWSIMAVPFVFKLIIVKLSHSHL